MEAHTKLVFIEGGAITADQYILEVLELRVSPFGLLGKKYLFMHDNAYPHVSRIVSLYRDDTEIRRMN